METTVEKVKVADLVRDAKAKFIYAQSGVLYYEIESKTHVCICPIDMTDIEEVKTTRFEAEYSGITLMRYIRKSMEATPQ